MSVMSMYGTIDVGSNSILLLIGRITRDGRLDIVLDTGVTTRLVKDLTPGGRLNPDSIAKTISVLQDFVQQCDAAGVREIAAVGTNALRMAHDADEFSRNVRDSCGISLEIIDPAKEAHLSYVSVDRDPCMPPRACVIDVGGGSTECTFPSAETISLPLGAVRLTEQYLRSDPLSHPEIQALKSVIQEGLRPLPVGITDPLVAIGGTAVTVAAVHRRLPRFDPSPVHGMIMQRGELRHIVEELCTLDLAGRCRIGAIPRDRTDILPAGALILLLSVDYWNLEKLYVSTHGVRYGLFFERFMR
jgi:exopolyphosphatase/guanosine-5'-triphosphate,3'-diphosphate pyrophosphatase